MFRMTKSHYPGNSLMIRAALDFLNNDFVSAHDFETKQEKIQNILQKKSPVVVENWRQIALSMFELGCVESAYLHVNARRGPSGQEHIFYIQFKTRAETGLAPRIVIPIKSRKKLQDRAAFHRKDRSLKAVARNPHTPRISPWEKPGGAV